MSQLSKSLHYNGPQKGTRTRTHTLKDTQIHPNFRHVFGWRLCQSGFKNEILAVLSLSLPHSFSFFSSHVVIRHDVPGPWLVMTMSLYWFKVHRHTRAHMFSLREEKRKVMSFKLISLCSPPVWRSFPFHSSLRVFLYPSLVLSPYRLYQQSMNVR